MTLSYLEIDSMDRKFKSYLSIQRLLKFSLFGLVVLSVFGCSQTKNIRTVDSLGGQGRAEAGSTILLMPPDVELMLLTASGLMEPQAEWTENAIGFMTTAIESEFAESGYRLVPYASESTDPDSDFMQLEKLHEAVGFSVLVNQMGQYPLPTKTKEDAVWSLGPKTQLLKASTGADYALFTFVRDSYSSSGRVAMQIGLALFGIGVPGGIQVGFASLVDLETGNIIWFNRLVDGAGDMREQVKADESVRNLLDNFPGLTPVNRQVTYNDPIN